MSYLIVRIEPKGNDVVKEGDGEPVVEQVSHRFRPNYYPRFDEFDQLAAEHGYELGHGVAVRVQDWPFIAYCYTSPNKEGRGRAGSQLERFAARRREGGSVSYKDWKDVYEVRDIVCEGEDTGNPGVVVAVRHHPRFPHLSNEKLYKVRWLRRKTKPPKGFMNEDLKPKTGKSAERRGFVLRLFVVQIAKAEKSLERMRTDRLSLYRLMRTEGITAK